MIYIRMILAWYFFLIGIGLHRVANGCTWLSMRAQGVYGFKNWPWSEDDLWVRDDLPSKGRSIMTFKARFLAENPNKIEFTMKITMTAEEWERLRDAMDKAPKVYELNQLRYAVCDVLAQARKIFWAQEEKTESTVQEP